MTYNFKQFIYCNETSNKNQPIELTKNNLISGDIFANYTLSQLGIQAPPGTKAYLNDSKMPIIVGFSGLLEIDLHNQGFITGLKFDENSLKNIEENDGLILIVDIVYLGGEK